MRKSFLAGIAFLAMGAFAPLQAATLLNLTGPADAQTIGPQSTSAPCIICGTTQAHNPAGFGYNNFKATGGDGSYNLYSTTPTAELGDGVVGNPYTVQQLVNAGGSIFDVAIDVDTTSAKSETLQFFEVLINGVQQFVYNTPTNIANGINNQGNGYADWLLKTVNLSTFAATDTVLFHATWSGAVDGPESFFLTNFTGQNCVGCTPTPTAVPIPAALPLFMAGLIGVGWISRKRKTLNLAA
jgi:hypothetical protein